MNTININLSEKKIIDDICIDNKLIVKAIKRSNNKYTYVFEHNQADIVYEELQKIYIHEGFDENYKHNEFGKNCKNIIEKFNYIGW